MEHRGEKCALSCCTNIVKRPNSKFCCYDCKVANEKLKMGAKLVKTKHNTKIWYR